MRTKERILGKLYGMICRGLYGLGIDQESKENLRILREHLKDRSAVVYFNHIAYCDGPIVFGFLLDRLGKSLRALGAPASQKHYDISREPKSPLGKIMRRAPLIGIQLLPVVQHYDKESYSDRQTRQLLREFVRGGRELLLQRGGILIIAPEGTRSEDGTLKKALPGIEHLERYGPSIAFCPIALIPEGKFDQGLNLGRRFRVRVGEPFSLSEISPREGETPVDGMMVRLARLLPENIRGVYNR